MREEMRKVYIADDGQEFATEEMCLRHETLVELEVFFEKEGWSGMNANDIARTIAERFDAFYAIFRKLKPEVFGYYDENDCTFALPGFYLNEESLVAQGRLIPLYR